MDWYVVASGQRYGPISFDELAAWARDGRILPGDPVWRAGMAAWIPASQVAELRAAAPSLGVRPPSLGDDPVMRAVLPVGRSGWAIAAGYLGLFSLLAVPGPFAIVTGILAVRAIRRDPTKHGMGRAIFGIVMGVIGCVLLVSLIAALKARR